MTDTVAYDLVCFSHLRWDFVFQRPQHLLTRFARARRVFYVEEPEWHDGPDTLRVRRTVEGVQVVVPLLGHDNTPATDPRPNGADNQASSFIGVAGNINGRLRALVDRLFGDQAIRRYVLWYYTPMALAFSDHLRPLIVAYDCMDELSGFAGAPAELPKREAELLARSALLTVGGQSLFEAKRVQHHNVHLFPSSIDVAHFGKARASQTEPDELRRIPRPRIGFAGVIDERMDLDLLQDMAQRRPTWHFCLIGPTAKIDPAALPRLPNIHYLGRRAYDDLPAYMSGWDVAILPFAHNSATRFISPTKTPEYLAAGLPVVSTSIRDVVRPYGENGLVRIADDARTFVEAIQSALRDDLGAHWARADAFLRGNSWDVTADAMANRVATAIAARETPPLRSSSPLHPSQSSHAHSQSQLQGNTQEGL